MRPMGNNPHLAFFNHPRMGEKVPQKELLEKSAETTDLAIITIGRNAGEYVDRKIENDFQLTNEEHALIQNVCQNYHKKGKKVVVILNVCGVVETASWKSLPDAILLAWQAGQEGGNTVADILKGTVNPSGKLPMTFPIQYMDTPSSTNFPYNYKADPEQIIASIFTNRGLKHEQRNVDYTEYTEDIFVGYRYFDTYNKEVSYPFGYGLSYSRFYFDNPIIRQEQDNYTISIDITNIGQVSGKEVIQLYVKAPIGSLPKPKKELKAFAKTKKLQPGEKQTISLSIKTADLASYAEDKQAWVVDSGSYLLEIGNCVADIKCSTQLIIP